MTLSHAILLPSSKACNRDRNAADAFEIVLACRFLIRNEGVTNRNWEGDSEGVLVTYRSIAGKQMLNLPEVVNFVHNK